VVRRRCRVSARAPPVHRRPGCPGPASTRGIARPARC
jgi:hypothetical protein